MIAFNSNLPQGLVLNLDAGSRRSHIESAGVQRSLIDVSSWTTGTGGIGIYNPNETVNTENQRLIDVDPWGLNSIIWQSNPSGDGNNDGGWNTNAVTIDPSKIYRFSVWMRRTSSTTGGTFYMGTSGNVKQNDTSAANSNPYWSCNNIGAYTQNQWYLVVGHVYNWNTTYTGKHPNTGLYTRGSGPTKISDIVCNIGTGDVKWSDPTINSTWHRTYHFYCGDSTSHLQWAFPRIDLIDGTEPSIKELLEVGGSQWIDTSSTKTIGAMVNNPIYSRNNNGQVIFDGVAQYVDCGNPKELQCSTEITITSWVKPTSTATYGNILSKNYNSGYRFRINADNSLLWYVSGNAAVSPANVVPNGVWSHLAVVGDGNGIRGYVNGVQVCSSNTIYTPTDAVSGNVLVGATLSNSELFNGAIGYVRVYNRGLTISEVAQDFNSSKKRYGL